MSSISLCMIVKNEGEILEDFLKCVKDCVDEIIIVDTGSTDNSKEIASRYGSVFDFKWEDDFSAARNFSISKATKDWILWLDPDEKLSDIDLIKIKDLAEDEKFMGYRFIQETKIGDLNNVQGICKLFRNNLGISFIYPVHESVKHSIDQLGGVIGKTGIIIKHYSDYNKEKAEYYLQLIEKKAKNWPESSAEKEKEFMLNIIESL